MEYNKHFREHGCENEGKGRERTKLRREYHSEVMLKGGPGVMAEKAGRVLVGRHYLNLILPRVIDTKPCVFLKEFRNPLKKRLG